MQRTVQLVLRNVLWVLWSRVLNTADVGDTEKVKAMKPLYKRSQEGKTRTRESAKEKSMLWRVFTSQV